MQDPSVSFAVRAASEGVPVGVIARCTGMPYDRVLTCLQRAQKVGAITEIPRSDWPPNGERAKSQPVALPVETEFLCRQKFHLTNLEAGFLAVLLRCLLAEKDKLHAVIEQQRNSRALRPERDVPDPKMVDVMICRLRRKLAEFDPSYVIRTSWGKGYYLDQSVKDMMLARIA